MVEEFLRTLTDGRRDEALSLIRMFSLISGKDPVMWGPSMIGFGSYDYRYDSGRTGTSFRLGFAPRKAQLVIYIMPGFADFHKELAAIGPCRHEKSCLYIKSLSKIKLPALRALAAKAWEMMAEKYPD